MKKSLIGPQTLFRNWLFLWSISVCYFITYLVSDQYSSETDLQFFLILNSIQNGEGLKIINVIVVT